MADKGYKVSYNAKLFRVRLSLSHAFIKSAKDFPRAFIDKAKSKMEAEIKAGKVKYMRSGDDHVDTFWTNAKTYVDSLETAAADTFVHFTLCYGCPDLEGVVLSPSEDEKSAVRIECNAPTEEMKSWPFEWFQLWAEGSSKEIGQAERLHAGHLQAVWRDLTKGHAPRKPAIGAAPSLNSQKPYSIVSSNVRGEFYLHINDFKIFLNKEELNGLVSVCVNAAKKISSKSRFHYVVLKQHLISSIRLALQDYQKFGGELPFVVLAGLAGKAKPMNATQVEGESQEAEKADEGPDYPGKGLLKVDVSDDRMQASIGPWIMENYELDVNFNRVWLDNEIKANGIHFGIQEKLIAEIIGAIGKKEDIRDMLIAEGQAGEAASGPYLYEVYKDHKPEVTDDDNIDMRDFQERTIVEEDELVALLRFENEAVMGKDVYGKELEPSDSEKIEVVKGEGINEKKYGEYYAKYTGMPVIDGKNIAVNKMLIHEGDVNLRSGNIRFDGPVRVKGSIDVGSVVEASGTLVVEGSVRGGFVRVGGDMEVVHGVITTKEGSIRCSGDFSAEFIENSNIVVSGNIAVKRVILNSDIYCGGSIVTDRTEGRITGGKICADKMVECGALGSPQGIRTEVMVGRDWKAELAVGVRSARYERLKEYEKELKKELSSLKSRSKAQMTKKHETRKEELQKKVDKLKVLVPLAKDYWVNVRDNIAVDEKARIIVHGELSPSVIMRIADSKCNNKQAVVAVQVVAQKKKGTNIWALEEDDIQKLNEQRAAEKAARKNKKLEPSSDSKAEEPQEEAPPAEASSEPQVETATDQDTNQGDQPSPEPALDDVLGDDSEEEEGPLAS